MEQVDCKITYLIVFYKTKEHLSCKFVERYSEKRLSKDKTLTKVIKAFKTSI